MRVTRPLRNTQRSRINRSSDWNKNSQYEVVRNSPYGDAAEFIKWSRYGQSTTYNWRQRYPSYNITLTDSVIADFYWNQYIKAWFTDPAALQFHFGTVWCVMMGVLSVCRHCLFNPDVTWRGQEKKLPSPDRHRQWSYSLPFFHHRLRNMCTKFFWTMAQTEPDWNNRCYSGNRPDRIECFRSPTIWSSFWFCRSYQYTIQDPMFTTISTPNICRMYHEMGYKKCPEMFGDGEEEED